MHIILDSNVYVSDLRMEGVGFSNLFDFMKKTKSTLVLLKIVRDEVIQRYVARYEGAVQDVAKAWKPYRYLTLEHRPERFVKSDTKYQVRELKKRLRLTDKGLDSYFYPETNGVNVDAVAMRGIYRIPPASSDGEELRDVIIWFIVLDYAKKAKEPVAFITADNGFWEGEQLREQIEADIKETGADLRLYNSLDAFIKANSPKQSKISEEWAKEFIPLSIFENMLVSRLGREPLSTSLTYELFGFLNPVRLSEIRSGEYQLREGTSYEINSEVTFVTASYDAEIFAKAEAVPNNNYLGQITSPWNQVSPLAALAQAPTSPMRPINAFLENQNRLLTMTTASPKLEKHLHMECKVTVTVRISGKAVTEKSLETFKVIKLEEMREVEKKEG